jgi:hypothetical protein
MRSSSLSPLISTGLDYARGLHETECVSKLLYAGAGQLQSLAFTATAWTLQRDSDLLQKGAEPAVLLESLRLVVDRIATPLAMNSFPFGAPNLRCLESSGVYIPWNAPSSNPLDLHTSFFITLLSCRP